jgi:hypothetical protein
VSYHPGVRRPLIILLLVAACSRGSSGSAPAEGVAGVVLEASGAVSARADGAADARPLVVGSEVLASDTLETAADASLRVRLYHNRALLALEGGKVLRLRESAAWLARPGAADPFERGAGTATAVAGREAEKTAVDTRATAHPDNRQAQVQPVQPPPVSNPDAKTRMHTGTPEPKLAPPTGGGGDNCDEVACLVDPTPACCARFRKGGGGGGGTEPGGDLPEAPGRGQIRAAMSAIAGALDACAAGLSAQVTVRVGVAVAPDGAVTDASVDGSPTPELAACVSAAARTARFPRSRNGIHFKYPVILHPATR